jgi:hypothetical protein
VAATPSSQTNPIAHPQAQGSMIFTILAGALTVVLVIAATFEFIPAWLLKNPPDQPHLWHIAELSALAGFLLGGCMLGMLRKPQEKPLLAQFFVLSTILLAIGITPFNLGGLVLLVIGFLFVLAYPDRRALLRIGRTGRLSLPLLGLTILYFIFLDPVIHQEIYFQVIGMTNDVHAMRLHWIGSALLLILLLIAGFMAATRGPGWKWLATITGINYIFLGIISMIVPDYAGSWAEWCGLVSIFGGVLYFFLVRIEIERGQVSSDMSVPPTITDELYEVQQERQLAQTHEADLKEL